MAHVGHHRLNPQHSGDARRGGHQGLRTYIREEFSATRAARVLFSHRDTVLNGLDHAENMLPAPLSGRGPNVELAFEIVHWLGLKA
ncbi:helix-turn-helix domain-containing protein [Streptomyces maoxianensis]|uniref:Helix-turn-helix domain-containing protein n=1 Tax=Streptomyces maoxianensis TaxID=1459942 RepID=A0ABV9G7Z9_9ACTN|nr:helix-turn-helix domain-containing protein [Streptomyces sp. ISL-1]MBT2388023.1 helix-turn-helix domain-containing protein [Streptomyces sp. ISL-1]